MDAHIRKVYVPMTETSFYILYCLQQPNHGYGIVQRVAQLTDGEIRLAPGTMYGSLSKMEKDGLIRFVREEERCYRRYPLTPPSILLSLSAREASQLRRLTPPLMLATPPLTAL